MYPGSQPYLKVIMAVQMPDGRIYYQGGLAELVTIDQENGYHRSGLMDHLDPYMTTHYAKTEITWRRRTTYANQPSWEDIDPEEIGGTPPAIGSGRKEIER